MKQYTILFVAIFFFFSCKKDNSNARLQSNIAEDPTIFQDQYGRQLILHGLNTSSSAKSEPERQPWITENNVIKEDTSFGFNFVRYLIFWDAIEPQKDVFDETYLDKVAERVNWYTSRGMYVMLDMHQDLYSIVFDGDGAPEWACRSNGVAPINLPGGTPWWLKNIDPAVVNCWVNFWSYSNHKDLQDHYILAWKKVAQRFNNNPYVIGYDLMNEPWGGDLIKTFITGQFEREQLAAFYNRLIPALRLEAPNKYLFFEPLPAPVTFGAASNLPKVNDSRTISKLAYAPHCYPYDTHEGLGYTASSKKNLVDWERERNKDVQRHGNIPLVCGEFGLSPSQNGFEEYMKDFHNMADRNQWNWTYWSNDRGGWSPLNADNSETVVAAKLVRVYPKATAGKIQSFSFDETTKKFEMTFTTNTAISQPTEIFVPKRFYPNGWNIQVSGSTNYSYTFDETKNCIKFVAKENAKEITIQLLPN